MRTLLGDDASAEDVTALAFERAYRRRASFDDKRGSRRGWLFGIARNAALDELRRRRRSAPLIGELPDELAPRARRGGRPRRPPHAPSAPRSPRCRRATASSSP